MKEFVCRMQDDVHKKIRELSYNNNISMSEIVREILVNYCEENSDKIIKRIKEKKLKTKKKVKQNADYYQLTEPILLNVWDNNEDEAYNDL